MSINQLTTGNTFGQWLTTTQALVTKYNIIEQSISDASNSANLVTETTNNFVVLVADSSNTINLRIFTAEEFINVTAQTATTTINTVAQEATNTVNSVVFTAEEFINVTAQTATTTINTAVQLGTDTINISVSDFSNTLNITLETQSNTLNTIAQTSLNTILSETENVINLSISVQNTSNYINVFVSDSINTINTYIETAENISILAFETANNVANTSNLALDVANQAFILANAATQNVFNVINETVSSNTFYPTLVPFTFGVPTDVYVSDTKLYYNPSTGQLSATNFNSLSDINKKKNIITIENALDSVMEMRGVSFIWKDTEEKSIGVIAQEIENILPEVVATNEHGEKSVSYGNIVGILIQAIKEMKKEIDELKKHINKP